MRVTYYPPHTYTHATYKGARKKLDCLFVPINGYRFLAIPVTVDVCTTHADTSRSRQFVYVVAALIYTARISSSHIVVAQPPDATGSSMILACIM